MTTYNAENERIKKAYFTYLKEADQKSDATINAIRKAILRLEEYTGYKPFRTFNKDQAIAFKKHLVKTPAARSGKPLAKATVLGTLNTIQSFLGWLMFQKGFRAAIRKTEIDYLNLGEKEIRAAKAPDLKPFPTPEQVRKALFAMPNETEIQKRDQALFAFVFLTGLRDQAITSLKLKHIDLTRNHVKQDPKEVQTKFSKRIDTFFFPVGDDVKAVFERWVAYLLAEKLYGPEDPLFPQTRLIHDENQSFTAGGMTPLHWSNATPIRKIFRQAFEAVSLQYFSPHRLRSTLTRLGQELCTTPEEFKAWSQNLGHESPLTTFTSYGTIDPYRQGKLIAEVGKKDEEQITLKKLAAMLAKKENEDDE